MIRNYFYILRNIIELNEKLKGKHVTDVYTQEKDVLFLQTEAVPEENSPALLISANFQNPFLLLKRNHKKAKKNYAEFCVDQTPFVIEGLAISVSDRLVKLSASSLDIYFSVRGPKTNVYFVKNGDWVRSFKKTEEEEETKKLAKNFAEENFTVSPETYFERLISVIGASGLNDEKLNLIRTEFPQINKEILLRFKVVNGRRTEDLKKIIEEIVYGEISVILTTERKVRLLPSAWKEALANSEEVFEFDSFGGALAKYLALKYKYDAFTRVYSEIAKKLERDLEFYANRMNNLKMRVENGSREIEYKKTGDLLLANIFKLRKGMKTIELEDFESGGAVRIKLDEKLPPNKNVERYYEKARDEKINFEKSKRLLEETEKKYFELLEIKKNLATINDIKKLHEIRKKLKLNDTLKKQQSGENIKYRKFLIDGKYQVFVGKDSKSNDALTLKFAKQNDLWFHARGVSGSHVILRIENSKEAIPKSVLKNVASVAAYFSKAKTAKLAPVAYTFRKFVHKKKGMPPGQVIISRETVLIVPPEIPGNAEEIYE